jgi:hypothetical protein
VKTLLAAARREHPNAQIDCEWATRRLPAKKSIVRTSRATGKRANPRARGHPGVVWDCGSLGLAGADDFAPFTARGNVPSIHWRSGRSSVKLWSSFAMPGCAPSFTPFVSATGVTPSSAKTRCGRCGAGGGRHAREGGAQRKARKRSEGQRKPSEGAWEVEGTHLAIGVADSRAVGVVRERRVRLSGVGPVLPVGLRERSARAG